MSMEAVWGAVIMNSSFYQSRRYSLLGSQNFYLHMVVMRNSLTMSVKGGHWGTWDSAFTWRKRGSNLIEQCPKMTTKASLNNVQSFIQQQLR
jgi:hypothetical protein